MRKCRIGLYFLLYFVLWTWCVIHCDVATVVNTSTEVGLSTLNFWFHELSGVHLEFYVITDWLGLVPLAVCLIFGMMGLVQLIGRRSLLKVDVDLILLGVYYLVVIVCYLGFEKVPVHYRPILIDGRLEASYPSSTTLLVMSVMPTLVIQCRRRINNKNLVQWIEMMTICFSVFMVVCRLISGVHWVCDIVGACLISTALIHLYCAAIEHWDKKE